MMLRYRYTCIVGTVYAFLVYLLYSSYETIKRTRFFLGDSIAKGICDKFDEAVYMDTEATWNDIHKFRKFAFWHYRWKILFTKVFAQDHFGFSPPLIGISPYTLIEDGSGIYTYYKESSYFKNTFGAKGIRSGIKQSIKYGSTYGKTLGRNRQCINRLVSDPSDLQSELLRGKKYELIDLQQLWDTASAEKKQLILDVFGVRDCDIQTFSRYKVIILTQPFVELRDVNEEELMSIYGSAIKAYNESEVIIKPHPSDKCNYAKYFQKAGIVPAQIPMQLLMLMGMKVDVAVTVFSTAVSLLPKETKIVWLGGKCHPKLEHYGLNECPYNRVSI